MARRRTAAKTPKHRPPGGGNGGVGDGKWICVGVITRPKGLRGAVRITSFTAQPADVAAYGPVHAGVGGERLDITVREVVKGNVVVAKFAGIGDREAAEALRGTKLYLPSDALPPAGVDWFYYAEIIGLRVETVVGDAYGKVVDLHDFGAGHILEITPEEGGETVFLPFTESVVPVIDLNGNRLVDDPPQVTYARPEEGDR